MAFKVLTEKSAGPKPKGDNLKIYSEFEDFYTSTYSKLNYPKKISGKNLSQIISYMCIDMLTNIKNNIKLHFIEYIRRFVNSSFKDAHNDILKEYKDKEKTKMREQLLKELKIIKNDLLNDTCKCDKKYYKWLNKYRNKILPPKLDSSYQSDINNDPQKYIKYMIFMNLELEKMDKKMFQFFPLRTEIKPHYIPIDTKSLIEIFIKNDKNVYLSDIENNKHKLWEKFFYLKHNIFKKKGFVFDYRIQTDGYVTSIQFLNENNFEEEQKKKNSMKKGKQKMKELCEGLSEEEAEKKKKEYYKEKKEVQKKKRQEKKEKFKELSKEEQQKILNNKKYIEFPYLDELDEDELNDIKDSLRVYVDPGKKAILTMMDDNGNKLKYTIRQRLHETKRLKYQRLLQNYKNKNGITETESQLSSVNSKSCSWGKFKDYIKKKNKVNKQLFNKYEDIIFRKYKWYGYINKKRSEDKLLDAIEEKFGKYCKIIYGDWGVTKQMRNFVPTPMIGIKRKIHERFDIYNIDEFRTTCLNSKTETKCGNLYLPDKKGKFRKLHSVLTYKMENNRYGCANRDWNSVKNMKKITDYWLEHKTRPLKYRRDYDLDTNTLRGSNPFEDKKLQKCQVEPSPERRIEKGTIIASHKSINTKI